MPIKIWLLILVLIWIPFGCERNAEIEEAKQQRMEELETEWTEQFSRFMTISHDHRELVELMQGLDDVWQEEEEPETFQAFYVNDDSEITMTGMYTADSNWEMAGKTNNNETFQVKRDEESVILEYDEIKEKLKQKEFIFLLPPEHFKWLKSMLLEQRYERAEHTLTSSGWNIRLVSTLKPMEAEITEFFSAHLAEEGQWNDHFLELYQIVYDLSITENNNRFYLESLTFQIQKNGESLEEVKFAF